MFKELKDLIQETDKEIRKKLRTIKPTEDEVKSMEEYEWISCVAPLKYYKLGYETALKQCQTIADEKLNDEIAFLKTLPTQSGKTSIYQRERIKKRLEQLNPAQTKQ